MCTWTLCLSIKKMMLAVTKTTESGEAIRLDAESILHESTVCRSSLQEIVEFATNSKTGCVSFFSFKLSEENSVKITDVGVSKDAKDITGTLAGTPVYIAPEVFHSKLYDSKADIYSFGIMLWEMWYGRQAFAEFRGPMEVFFCMVDGYYRPEEVKGEKKPPARWKQLMNRESVLGWES